MGATFLCFGVSNAERPPESPWIPGSGPPLPRANDYTTLAALKFSPTRLDTSGVLDRDGLANLAEERRPLPPAAASGGADVATRSVSRHWRFCPSQNSPQRLVNN